jgi:hypothetical protein
MGIEEGDKLRLRQHPISIAVCVLEDLSGAGARGRPVLA